MLKYLTNIPNHKSLWSPLSLKNAFNALTNTYEGSLWRFYPLSLLCWLILALSSILSPCDMCHSLIGCKEAQSMCSPLMQSEPSMSFSPSLHLSPQSLKPLAYKLDPSPLQKEHNPWSKVIMPFWEAILHQNHTPTPKFQLHLKPFLKHSLSIHPI